MPTGPASADCCPALDPLPPACDIKCLMPELCKEFKCLMQRHARAFTKRQRIWNLAEPRYRTEKLIEQCACRYNKPVRIIRMEDPIMTRTEQLAYPQARKMILFKEQVKYMYPSKRLEIINRLIRHSLFSVYSRLGNVQPPVKYIPVHKWTKKEWKVHMRYISKLAKAKIPPRVPRLPIRAMPLKQMRRFKKLAKPRKRTVQVAPIWKFTIFMKKHKATERELSLSKPVSRGDDEGRFNVLPIKVTPNALAYKISPRMKELSTAIMHAKLDTDVKENPFSISPNALKAKPSKRTKELAEPKEFENKHIRENPNLISPAALKAKPSPRTIELAKPKGK